MSSLRLGELVCEVRGQMLACLESREPFSDVYNDTDLCALWMRQIFDPEIAALQQGILHMNGCLFFAGWRMWSGRISYWPVLLLIAFIVYNVCMSIYYSVHPRKPDVSLFIMSGSLALSVACDQNVRVLKPC
jgi:hypothetical protein